MWLHNFLELRFGIPSQDTYLRVLAAIDEREFREAFMPWSVQAFPRAAREGHIAIDGKTARRSGDKAFEKKAVHMVSALACEHGLVLAQQPTTDRRGELNAIRALLDLIYLKGSLVSIDANGCRRSDAKKVTDHGGDYLFALKGNESTLRDATEQLFEATIEPSAQPVEIDVLPTASSYQHVDAGHGRIETRRTHVLHTWGEWVPVDSEWAGL